MHTFVDIRSPRVSHAAWLPLVALVAYAIIAAAGVSLTSESNAATSSATVDVGASVLPEVHLSFGTCGTVTGTYSRSFTGPALSVSDEDVEVASCAVVFGSNNNGSSGATLSVESARPGPSTNSFCNASLASSCSAPQFADVSTAGVSDTTFFNADAGATGAFGVLLSSSGCGGGAWSSSLYYGLAQDTDASPGSQVCSTGSMSDGNLTFSFRANPGDSQPAVSYQVRAKFTAQAS